MGPAPFVKICGVTRVGDAEICVEAGASAIGLNFIESSKRRVDEATARSIIEAARGRIEIVGVVADRPADELLALRDRLRLDWLQLHGDESPEQLARLLPHAYKAVRVGAPADVARAREYGGERILLDALVPGELGGTGATFDWTLARSLTESRSVLLAGGLTPENVAEAVRTVRPWGVDVASGVETSPGVKDPSKVAAFLRAARSALTAALVVAVFGCSSPSMRGGRVVRHGAEPEGAPLSTFSVGQCRDRAGGEVPGPSSLVSVVKKDDGGLVLVESREPDALVVDNVIPHRDARVFQAVLRRDSGRRTLREYRLPADLHSSGALSVVSVFQVEDTDSGFVGRYREAALVCALEYIAGPP